MIGIGAPGGSAWSAGPPSPPRGPATSSTRGGVAPGPDGGRRPIQPGAEIAAAALAGFDIDRFKPALVCVEAPPPIRQRLVDYFARHRYRIVAKYLWADSANLYFAPMTESDMERAP